MIEIETILHAAQPATVAVAWYDLHTNREFFSRADESFYPASTFKVGVMMEAFHRASQGLLNLEDKIPVVNSFTSAADGSSFSIQAEDDSDTTLYEKIGGQETLRGIIHLMIARSSNLGTNILVERLGAQQIQAYLRQLGVEGVHILRGVYDVRAYAQGIANSASARGLMHMMQAIADGKAAASQEMIEILFEQEFNEGIPARLPKSARVAHKTGWMDDLYHDCGIIFPEKRKPYLLAVMTTGFKHETDAHACVASISETIYKAL
ncbi:MAG: hypothetical protein HFACDABA_00436 [Anaerolineales bacterium]|nr:hypothetical protein [Anaerolineales bacterium]